MLSDNNLAGNLASEFKLALSLYVQTDSQLLNSDRIEGLQKELLVGILYKKQLLRGYTSSFGTLWDYPGLKGFQFKMAPGSNQLIRGLAHCFL